MATFNGEAIGTPATYTDQGKADFTGTFRMRATDTGLSKVVYWYSTGIDSTGTQYTGTGPLTDIVVVR